MQKGQKQSKESREKMRRSHLGKSPWNKGKFGYKMPPSSNEKKRKISIALTKNNGQRGKPPWNKGLPHLVGKKHWNWKGGITPENVKLRNSPDAKEWRKNVFGRDSHSCQMPGCASKIGTYLVAHHVRKWSKYPALRFVVSNGITLCKACDSRVYRKEEHYEKLFRKIIEVKYGS